jgi:Domain of unknown function (DUF5668)
MSAPPPIPTPRGSLARALNGPLVLTTLGVLLAADRLGHVSFWRTWPALLIVFGALKLVEHLGPDQGERSR